MNAFAYLVVTGLPLFRLSLPVKRCFSAGQATVTVTGYRIQDIPFESPTESDMSALWAVPGP